LFIGYQGSIGTRGPIGPVGDRGPAGFAGANGRNGLPGPFGEKGEQGDKGLEGDKGQIGDKGTVGEIIVGQPDLEFISPKIFVCSVSVKEPFSECLKIVSQDSFLFICPQGTLKPSDCN